MTDIPQRNTQQHKRVYKQLQGYCRVGGIQIWQLVQSVTCFTDDMSSSVQFV